MRWKMTENFATWATCSAMCLVLRIPTCESQVPALNSTSSPMCSGTWRRGGFCRKGSQAENKFAFVHSNEDIRRIVKSLPLSDFVTAQSLKFIAHICRRPSTHITKRALFAIPTKKYYQDPWRKIAKDLGVDIHQARATTQDREKFTRLLNQRFPELRRASSAPNSANSNQRI